MTNSWRRRAGLRCAGLVLALVALLLSCREATPPADRGLELVASTLPGGGHPFAIVADDFNRDGKTDLAVTNPKVSKVSIYLGHGDGTFEKPAHFATGLSRSPRTSRRVSNRGAWWPGTSTKMGGSISPPRAPAGTLCRFISAAGTGASAWRSSSE